MLDPWEQRKIEYGFADPPPVANGHISPPKPPTGEPDARDRAYALGALRSAAFDMATTNVGRNHELNRHAFKLAGFIAKGSLAEEEVIDALTVAAREASVLGDHAFTEGEIAATLRSALGSKGFTRVTPDDGSVTEVARGTLNNGSTNGHPVAPPVPTGRVLDWQRGGAIPTAAPVWAWHYADKGRIQLGTLALLAGRPGAGKSTAARWFAAHATRGTLGGCWQGKPQHVVYIASEESARYVVAPGLIAAGADMDRIHFPSATRDGEATALLSTLDEAALTAYCVAHHVSLVIVDPLMSTMTSMVDLNKNNEIRGQLSPWGRMADTINGVVLGVAHLRKSNNGDVVAAVTGSSAFGEIARAVFGFAKNPDGDTRVMSQHKNSTGYEDLSVTYEIASVPVNLADGKTAEVGAFAITGTSEVTVEDILGESGMQSGGGGVLMECQRWLDDFLSVEGPLPSKDVKGLARKEGDWSAATTERAARKLKVVYESRGFPRHTYWSMPIASPVATQRGEM